MAARLEAMAVRRADGVVALTRYTEERVAGKAKRTWVVPNAVDEEFLSVRNTPEPGLVLCVAHVNEWKRQVELMEALDTIPDAEKPRLVFLGQALRGHYVQRFMEAVTARSSWCEHAGNVGREGLRGWLARADLLVLPSIEDNCPMVALEAMAAGVPVVASDIGGIPDLVLPGVSGERFDPRDPVEMAAKVYKLLRDKELRDRLAASAKQHATATYHPRVIAEKHIKIYTELMNTIPQQL
jgi:glycosyltransferase involved in cell wall biosynthesis